LIFNSVKLVKKQTIVVRFRVSFSVKWLLEEFKQKMEEVKAVNPSSMYGINLIFLLIMQWSHLDFNLLYLFIKSTQF